MLLADHSWQCPFDPEKHTVVLCHFDEGTGDETCNAMDDKSLTLRANKRELWGRRDAFGATARFAGAGERPLIEWDSIIDGTCSLAGD